ncbi:hypothetical protein DFJ74DRAFT_655651 [Hyaloraphidium curvatum]|nr:hypothetical protein DFJ74DRAFT_655651 [Hyaloraphidium curvatum]
MSAQLAEHDGPAMELSEMSTAPVSHERPPEPSTQSQEAGSGTQEVANAAQRQLLEGSDAERQLADSATGTQLTDSVVTIATRQLPDSAENGQLADANGRLERPYVPFFDVDTTAASYRLRRLDPTARLQAHGLAASSYSGPPLLYRDPVRTELEDGKSSVRALATYRHMLARSLERAANGEYTETRLGVRLWIFLFAAIAGLFIILSILKAFGYLSAASIRVAVEEWFFFFVLLVGLPWVFFLNSPSRYIKGLLLVLDLWVLSVFVLKVTYQASGEDTDYRFEREYQKVFVSFTVVFVFLAVCLIVGHVLWHYLLPYLLRKGLIDDAWTRRLWRVDPIPGRPGSFSYRFVLSLHRGTCTYRGATDENGLPHGYGEWLDDGIFGEALVGWFDHGTPVAPFESTVTSTGSAFSAKRVGLIRNNRAAWDSGNVNPARDPGGLAVGVAAVEVSVAGKFLRHLPKATLLMEPKPLTEASADRMVRLLSDPPMDPTLEECVLYIHGLWNTAQTAVCEISQARGLAGFGPNYKFFAFDWPAGLYPFASFRTVRDMSKSDGVKADLKACLQLLNRIGFSKIHIIGHSMGCRVACQLSEFAEDVFRPLHSSQIPPRDPSLPALGSLTLIHGELDLMDFIGVHFPVLRQFTNSITSYTDFHDKALEMAEVLTGRLSMGRNPAAYFVDPFWPELSPWPGALDIVELTKDQLRALASSPSDRATFKRRETDLKEAAARLQPDDSSHVGMPVEENGGIEGPLPVEGRDFSKNTNLRKKAKVPCPRVKAFLDCDVVDSSFLDANAGRVRHSTFVYNPSVLGDIHEVVTAGRRARERTARLLRRSGNVFYFLKAPSYVSI